MPDCTYIPMEIVSCVFGLVNFVFLVGLLASIFSKEEYVFSMPKPLVMIVCVLTLIVFNIAIFDSRVTPEELKNNPNVCENIYIVEE